MSATEAVVTKPEETKAMAEAPAVPPQVEAAVVPDAMPAVDATPAEAKPADADAKPADAEAKPDAADAKPADAMPATDAMTETKPEPKNRNILGKFWPFKGGKASKSPKKEKKDKKEGKKVEPEVMGEETPMATPAAEAATNAEVPKAAEVTMVTDSAQATPVAAVTEEVKEAPMEAAKEAPKEMSPPKETKDAPAPKATKLQRRISQVTSQVTDIFRSKPKLDVPTSPKVDELPPKIEQPKSVAPLENPASDPARVPEAVEVATPAMATPIVAATA